MKRALGLMAVLAAGACASAAPAPIDFGRGARAPAVPQAQREEEAPAGPARAHPPSEPDWAALPGPSLADYALQPDAAQPFDPARTPRSVRVGANEQLYDIATRYQIPLRALIDENGLSAPYALHEGQTLRLPAPRFHRVARGESFEEVARRYTIDPRSLGLLNRMSAPFVVREGDRLVLPAMARAVAEERGPPAPSPANAAPAGEAPAVRASFAWPLRGNIVARFGAQTDGRRLDGVEISARAGDEAHASADGEVVYAGADLPAYGALVLVRHAGDYVTAYGFGARALVREGQRVRAGDAVLEVGRIGGDAKLLFQIRQGSRPVDPLPLLK